MPKLKALILLPLSVFFLLIPNPGAFAENITITTYYPAPFGVYNEMRAKRMAIGDAYYQASDYCWAGWPSCTNDIDDEADLIVEGNVGIGTIVEGNVGIGTITPQSPAPDRQQGNLDVNDVYLRSTGQWMSEGGIPSGAITAFDLDSCPVGWSELITARGRVVVGLNPGDASFNSRGETGGAKTHTLTISEMPSHTHSEVRESFTRGAQGYAPGFMSNPKTVQTGATGNNQPHNNLQPYISFIYCRKN